MRQKQKVQANLDSMVSSGQTGLCETLTKTNKQKNKIILSMNVSCNEHGQKDRQADQKIEAGSPLLKSDKKISVTFQCHWYKEIMIEEGSVWLVRFKRL